MHGCILTLGGVVNQRCTCVNKRKKKRKQAGIKKEYRRVPVAVELVGDRKVRVRTSLQNEDCASVEQPQPRCGRSAALVNRKIWLNIAVFPCLHSSLTHNRNINPLKNKVWEIHIFYKKCVRSFIEVRKLCLIMFPLISIFICGYTTVCLNWDICIT